MPGPTNTLLATASATVGIRRALRLVVAEGIAYLIAILVMRLSFGLFVTVFPMAGTALRVLVCIYLVYIA